MAQGRHNARTSVAVRRLHPLLLDEQRGCRCRREVGSFLSTPSRRHASCSSPFLQTGTGALLRNAVMWLVGARMRLRKLLLGEEAVLEQGVQDV